MSSSWPLRRERGPPEPEPRGGWGQRLLMEPLVQLSDSLDRGHAQFWLKCPMCAQKCPNVEFTVPGVDTHNGVLGSVSWQGRSEKRARSNPGPPSSFESWGSRTCRTSGHGSLGKQWELGLLAEFAEMGWQSHGKRRGAGRAQASPAGPEPARPEQEEGRGSRHGPWEPSTLSDRQRANTPHRLHERCAHQRERKAPGLGECGAGRAAGRSGAGPGRGARVPRLHTALQETRRFVLDKQAAYPARTHAGARLPPGTHPQRARLRQAPEPHVQPIHARPRPCRPWPLSSPSAALRRWPPRCRQGVRGPKRLLWGRGHHAACPCPLELP